MTAVIRGMNILYSAKYSIQPMKLDNLSCSNSFCLDFRAGTNNSKNRGVHGEHWRQKTNLFLLGEA